MSQYTFGTGDLFAAATSDATGATIATPTPVKFGELQDVGIDISRDLKLLYGQNNMPVAIGGGKMKFDFKAKYARVLGRVFNDLFFGGSMTAGTLTGVFNDLTGRVVPATPFQLPVAPPQSGTFDRDLGVIDDTGMPLVRVASAPAAGQYSVSAVGVYTFNTASTGKTVFINYTYTATAANSKKIALVTQAMGDVPTFGVDLAVKFNGKQMNWRFPNCVSSKLSFDPKQDDFSQVGFDFSCFADPLGNIGYIITAE